MSNSYLGSFVKSKVFLCFDDVRKLKWGMINQSITFDFGLRHITVSHLVYDSHTLIFLYQPDWTKTEHDFVKIDCLNWGIRLECANPEPSVRLLCALTRKNFAAFIYHPVYKSIIATVALSLRHLV